MKYSFITVLSLLVLTCPILTCTASGQNAPIVRVEAPDNVAEVNGERISRSSLAAECLQLHGADELHDLINKTLIRLECERQKITIASNEVDAEIVRRAQTFNLTSETWLNTLEENRGIPPEQYRQDIHWQLALGKLAESRLTISPQELLTEYEKNFGAAVQARQIVLASKTEAEEVLATVAKHPETFARVAQNKSVDEATAPFGGMMHPIRRHTYQPQIENLLFSMQPGDLSPVVEFPVGFFTIFRCEQHLQPQEVDFERVKQQLSIRIWDSKLPQAANEILLDLQKQTQVQIVSGNHSLQVQHPGVAAILHRQGQNPLFIMQQELADACIRKFGKGVLSDMINRRIVEQACRRENIIIAEQDIDNEIREMALKYLPPLPTGAPNVDLWIQRALEEHGLSEPMYRKNVVVPMLSLKRLTRPLVQVTEEDIQRSFEANYGKKVQCLAIMFDARDQRRAMDVWRMANQNLNEESFSDLARRYSVDPVSRQSGGIIPPISRHFGHPDLERAVFALQPGELSQIVQVDDSFVILFCVRHIPPVSVTIEEVRVDLIADIFEKKQQIIVARYFEKLREQSVFANYLTGEMQNPALESSDVERRAQEGNVQR